MTALSPTPARLAPPPRLAGFGALDHLVREQAPHWLLQAELAGVAASLLHLPPIADVDTARKANGLLGEAQLAAYRAAGVASWADIAPTVFDLTGEVKAAEQASWSAVTGGWADPDYQAVAAVASKAHAICVYAAQASSVAREAEQTPNIEE